MPRRWPERCSEAILLTLACLAPWAFGSVEAWAELLLDFGVVLVAILGLIAGRGRPARGLFGLPSLALAGLILLALAQATPLPEGLFRQLAPTTSELRSTLLPDIGEQVLGDSGSPVPRPGATISLDPEGSIHAAVRLLAAWVLFQCVLSLGGGYESLRRFGVAMSINAAALALFALTQRLTWEGKIYGLRTSPIGSGWSAGGPFVGHNPLAAMLNIGLGLGLGIILAGSSWRRLGARAWVVYTVGLTIVGLIASQARSGLVATLAASGVMAVLIRRREIARSGAAIAGIVSLAVLFLIFLGSASPYHRLATLFGEEAYTPRLKIWTGALQTWSDHPIFGTGLGSFGVATAPAFDLDSGVHFARAENEYVDLLVEGGLVGLGLALAGLVGLFSSIRRALRDAPGMSERALVAGGLFGLMALAIQSLGDFSPHILGVSFPAVVLAGHLAGLGSARQGVPSPTVGSKEGLQGILVRLAIASLAMIPLVHSSYRARSEAQLANSGVPMPGTGMPLAISPNVPRSSLDGMRLALEEALKDRPNWGEGHLRLGLVLLGQYERTVTEWIGDSLDNPVLVAWLSDPLWLHATIHSDPSDDREKRAELIEHEPVRRYLVPAARCFLEARRCSPAMALPHAHLASLDYLLVGGEPSLVHAARALKLAGADTRALLLTAKVAAQAGDPGLAALAWRRCLEARESRWEEVADSAAMTLEPSQILEEVLPEGGTWPIKFAERLYSHPEDSEVRAQYLQAALRRLPDDASLSEPERLRLKALARAGLGESLPAQVLWEKALALEPTQSAWREELVNWLVDRGEFEAAHRHATLGLRLNPESRRLRRAVLTTAEVLARGRKPIP